MAEDDATVAPAVAATLTELPSPRGDGPAAAASDARDDGSRYTVAAEVARGGLGRILKAHDERLDRTVAIKESLAPADARFRREAAITARLEHPSIVPVHDAGTWKSGAPYYVMKLLSGGHTLKHVVAETTTLAGRLALLPNIIAVADAVAYAHSLDIIHRDLKPSNVLLGPFGETLVIDWGLAKDLARPADDDDLSDGPYRAAASELTSLGTIVGTPQYMAPEQARGERVDKRADVYALGALIYHVLSGNPPYAPGSSVDVLARVRSQEPVALARLVKGVPKDLCAIVGKAMARAPDHRYADAQALVEDLRRFWTGQLVGAQDYSAATLAWRWMARHRAPLVVALAFLVVSGALAIVGVRRLARERDVANTQRAAAVAKRNELILLQARASLEHDPTQTIAWLKTYPLDGGDWQTVQALASEAKSLGVARHLLPTRETQSSALLVDGRLVTAPSNLHQLDLWDVTAGVKLRSVALADGVIADAASRTSATLFVGAENGDVLRWNVDEAKATVIGKQPGRVETIRLSTDEKFLATSEVGAFTIWNLRDGTAQRVVGTPGALSAMAFADDSRALYFLDPAGNLMRTPIADTSVRERVGNAGPARILRASDDGSFVATGGKDGMIHVWPVAGGPPVAIRTGNAAVQYLRIVPHSNELVAIGADYVASLWDRSGRLIQQLPSLGEPVIRVEVSADGATITLAAGRGFALVWDPRTGRTQRLRGHAGTIMTAATGREGLVVTGGSDHETRVWPAASRPLQPLRVIHLETAAPHIAFSPDGAYLAADGPTPQVCAVASGTCRALVGHTGNAYGIAFAPDGTQVVTAGWDGTARVWDVATGLARVLHIAGARAEQALFTPDGRHIVVPGSDGPIYVWPRAGGEPTRLRGHVGDAEIVALSSDSRTLVSGGDDHTVRLWDLTTGTGRVLGTLDAAVFTVAITADGHHVAAGDYDGTVRLWSLRDGSSRTVIHYRGYVGRVAFSPDGRFLASSSNDEGAFSVFELATGRLDRVHEHENVIRSVEWSPDGRRLVSWSVDGTIRLWDRQTGAVEVLAGHDGMVNRVAFTPDGKLMASSGADRTIRLWDATLTPSVPRDPTLLAAYLATLTSATVH